MRKKPAPFIIIPSTIGRGVGSCLPRATALRKSSKNAKIHPRVTLGDRAVLQEAARNDKAND
jgi:hypothetical protein